MSEKPITYDGTDDALGSPLGTVYNLQFEGGRIYYDFVSEYSYRRLQSELYAAQKDAERYRWLREGLTHNGAVAYDATDLAFCQTGAEFDAAIDAAIAAEQQPRPASAPKD